jgi:uncharacterized protein YdhG (YjbR/CyaY superfamily)
MSPARSTPKDVDEYIAGFPKDVQTILRRVRKTIRLAAPAAEEKISYQIPTFSMSGGLLSYAAWKKHIALYPVPTGSERLNKKLSVYRSEKSTVRFPLDQPIPYNLITEIVKFRVRDNLKRAAEKGKK